MFVYKKPVNEVDLKNKKFIKMLQSKKGDRNLRDTVEMKNSKKTFYNSSVMFNRPELVDNRFKDIKKDEEVKNDEFNKLLQDLSSFDYDKYVKDLELREALYLIKSKVDKDTQINEDNNIDNEIQTLLDDNKDHEVKHNREEIKTHYSQPVITILT